AAALADYDDALRGSPPYWQPHHNRAQILLGLGDLEAALSAYERAQLLHPDPAEARVTAPALCVRGLLAMRDGNQAEADMSFTAAIDADPTLADAWANRASILFKQGDAEAALRDLDRAIALRADGEILYNRARVLESLSRWREAATDYSSA